MVKHVHIGSLIQKEMAAKRCPVAWLAEQLCCDRSNIHRIYKKQSVDTGLLANISNALHFDFFRYYVETSDSDEYNCINK
jgi:hypothetical protein